MKHPNLRQHFLPLTAALVLMLASNTVLATAGKVVFASGDVQVERAGSMLPLAKGAAIEPGDTIVTGTDGRVQLHMADGDRMALRSNTRLRVDEFKAPTSPKTPETGRSFYSLVQGGFRAVTRSLDRRGLDSYRVKTPVATLGIRGTKYWVIQWPGGDGQPPGLYFGVTEGGISVGNAGGQMNFVAGQFGYVKDANTPPQLLNGPPSFLNGGADTGGSSDFGSAGGYSGGSPTQGCTNPLSGDVNCPPVQPIRGGDTDFTSGNAPPPPPTSTIIPEGPPIDGPR